MQNLSNLISSFCEVCPGDRMIKHVMHDGKQIPLEKTTQAQHVTCPRCQGKVGFYIPHLQTWSCLKDECMIINANLSKPKTVNDFQEKKAALDSCHQPEEILNFLRNYAKNPTGFLLLVGPPGKGKTYSATATYDDLKCDSGDKKLTLQIDLFTEWNDHIDCYGSMTHLLRKYSDYKLLVLDDLGSRKPSEAFMDFLYALAEKRYSQKKATIFITNLTSEEMLKRFGDAFVSRITAGKIFRIDDKGKDRRRNSF